MRYLIPILMLLSCGETFGQAKTRKLPNIINHPSLNIYSPFISASGNALIFVSDNAEDGVLTPFFSMKENADWKQPQVLPKSVYTRLNFISGYALSADGKSLLSTTIKGPGVGGYDLWLSQWKQNTWGEPANLGLPVNSKGHEGAPSITVDGTTLYFMRCEKMDQNGADNCKIFRTVKNRTGQWDEPVALPDYINTGNSQAPRIMGDGETLVFSSNKLMPNKGGMDLYLTRYEKGTWSQPKPLEFINTEKDDRYVSAEAVGRYLLRDIAGPRKNELVEYLFPKEIRPQGMLKVEGKVSAPDGTIPGAYVSAYDFDGRKMVYNARATADGGFLLYLREGSRYEVVVDPEDDKWTFFSRYYDLKKDELPPAERLRVMLQPLENETSIDLDISFRPSTAEIELEHSENELKRIIRMMEANPDFEFELQVLMKGYKEDSLRSSADLTEVRYDTINSQLETIDSLGNLVVMDTFNIKTTFHNDRTKPQAEAVVRYLQNSVPGGRLKIFTNAIEATRPEDEALSVRIIARKP